MKVVIYGKPACVFCTRAKDLVKAKGIDHEYVDFIETGMGREGLEEIVGGPVTTVPQIFVDNVHIGGYTDLVSHLVKSDESEVKV